MVMALQDGENSENWPLQAVRTENVAPAKFSISETKWVEMQKAPGT